MDEEMNGIRMLDVRSTNNQLKAKKKHCVVKYI